MNNQQASGAGKGSTEAATVKALLEVRDALLDLATEERQLSFQHTQLESQITSYERQIREVRDEHLALVAQQRVSDLQKRLADLQQQLEHLRAQKDLLAQRQQVLQDQIQALRAEQQRAALHGGDHLTWTHDEPPWTPQRSARSKETPRLLLVMGILVLALIGSLTLAHTLHLPSQPLPTDTSTLLPDAPFFHPNGKGPDDDECQQQAHYVCFSPEELQRAFNLNPLYREGYNGSGQTIVILGAGYTTTLQNDLHMFDLAWGLPDPDLTILQPHGLPNPYVCGTDTVDTLQRENTLDVEWAHAIAPGAKIVLIVGANGSSTSPPDRNCVHSSLIEDIRYALDNHLGQIISTSFGSSELGLVADKPDQVTGRQNMLKTQAHALLMRAASEHVTIVAASGSAGATNPNDLLRPESFWKKPNVSWPASDPYVLAVGGTNLTLTAADTYAGETAWNSSPDGGASGGGLSALFSEPEYQKTLPNQGLLMGKRGVPDVAFPALSYTIYGSYSTGLLGKVSSQWYHWDLEDSTSAGALCWAGLIAIANQMAGQPLGFIHPTLYAMQGLDMHDITQGENSFAGVQGYEALPGYDLVTGWGTPIANQFLLALVQTNNHTAAGCQASNTLCT